MCRRKIVYIYTHNYITAVPVYDIGIHVAKTKDLDMTVVQH